MAHSTLEPLQHLSDKIKDEEMSLIMEQMVKAYLNQENDTVSDEDPRKQTEREKHAILLLRSMRIHLCLDLIKQGHSSCIEDFKKDWAEVIECLKFLECVWKVPNELFSDAVDIILLLDPAKRNDLLRLLDFPTRLKIKKRTPLRFHVVDCAFHMANYCLETSRADELFHIISNLVALSEERNAGDLNKHRAITAQALFYTVENDHALTYRICKAQQRYFEGILTPSACRFYWFYAFSLLQLERDEEAFPILKHCYELCLSVEGETSWIGAKSGSLYHYHLLFSETSEKAEKYLWDLLKKIDSNFYHNMDATADLVAASTRSVLLKFHLDQQNMRGLLPEIERFREYCVSVEETNLNPRLTVRHAENMLAGYFLESGDYLQAADHSLKALNSTPPNGLPADPSDVLIYTNLLLVYTALNDEDQIRFYAQKLDELADEYADDDFVSTRVSFVMSNAARRFEIQPEDQADNLEEMRKQLLELYHEISRYELEPDETDAENTGFAFLVFDLCSSVLDSFTADRDELIRMRKIVTYFMDRPKIYRFNYAQQCTCYTLLTQIEWQLDSPKALEYLSKGLHLVDSISASREARIAILRFAAIVYYTYHHQDRALSMVEDVLTSITAAWKKATAYLNDHRVCQLLSFIQIHFGVCYAILRASVKPEAIYECVLQFKNLPALVGRERNRLLRLAPVNDELKNQIFVKQDQLAAAELNDSLHGTNNAHRVASELEHLEAIFASQFPENLHFTNISYDRVCEKLPNNSAIIEYFFALNETILSGKPCGSDAWDIDIFVTTKKTHVCQLKHLKIKRGDLILDQADQFIHILLNPDDVLAAIDEPTLRSELYRKLIAPVIPLLNGITSLYIAPDNQLCNLPLETLHVDGGNMLQDQYKVCRLVSGRDLLFCDDLESTEGSSFILGDPNYDSERGERSHSHSRSTQMSLEPVAELPFSGVEAARIGQRCRSRICTGDAATKFALQDALPCRIIHLATHGVFDDQLETDSLYASHLVFAGYNKWVSNKTESSYCGNGVLTADEISRMDLKKTELVVLSACQSGLGDTSYGSVRGLLSAFSAAGARWIISHMWSANDFSTAILMDAFYDAWLNKGKDVPDALQYAKNYLRTATIGMLRQNGWFDLPNTGRFSEDDMASVEEMRRWPADLKPFEEEYFWAGFTVHKTR